MPLTLVTTAPLSTVSNYEPGRLVIADTHYDNSVLLCAKGCIANKLPTQLQLFDIDHWLWVIETSGQSDVLLIGTGRTQQFLDQDSLQIFARALIAPEVMTSAAACRTYNLLLSEARQVAAVIII